METTNLIKLRELRDIINAAEASINRIMGAATNEAVAILAAQGLKKGEFEVEGVGTFQLQRTEVFNLADYHQYKEPEAVNWRKNAKKKYDEQQLVKARSALMNGYMKTYAKKHPDKEPDEVKLTIKCVDRS